jgi:AraC family transcriptional regulator of arabinose operon
LLTQNPLFLPSAPAASEDGAVVMDARVAQAAQIIVRNIQSPPTVKALAAQLRLSPSRLQHLFKKEMGLGLIRFIRATRLARANAMLQDPTRRVKEVALAVGYPDLSKFSHDFKKHYGQPPSWMRKIPVTADFR